MNSVLNTVRPEKSVETDAIPVKPYDFLSYFCTIKKHNNVGLPGKSPMFAGAPSHQLPEPVSGNIKQMSSRAFRLDSAFHFAVVRPAIWRE